MAKNDALHIDMGRLHVEWARQAELYHDAAMDLADAKADVQKKKADLDLAEADCDDKIRRDPPRYIPGGKATGEAVAAAVIRHPDYQEAVANHLDAVKKQEDAFALVMALDHKKRALEGLVQLRLADYFADPVPPKGSKDRLAEDSQDEVIRRGQEKQRKRRAVEAGDD